MSEVIQKSKEKPLTVNSVKLAKELNVSPVTIWRWKRDGKLPPHFHLNGRPVWKLEDIEAWLSTQAAGGEI